MNRKQRKTLAALFADPVRANIAWDDIISLLGALGAQISQGRGSRIRVVLHDVRATFHEPHPEKEAGKKTVATLREFLIDAGESP